MADTRLKDKAVATAFEYQQGNIAGLDDATTRRLVASVVLHKSRGGDIDIEHPAGFIGRYQAGATWLAAASYIDQDKLKNSMSEHRSEWAWAKSGGMTPFLEDASNWKNGLTLDNYKQSAALQDGAFKINADGSYQRAVKQGVLGNDDNALRVAGFLKVDQMSGYGAAVAALTGGRSLRDARGVSNYDYLHDITRNRDGLNELMSQAMGALKKNEDSPLLSNPNHPDHALYKQALIGLEKLPANAFRNEHERQNAAASLASEAKINGLNQIDHIALSANGASLFAVQGKLEDPAHSRIHQDRTLAAAQPIEKSTAQIEQEISQKNTQQIQMQLEQQKLQR
jgi:hypothetical protein